MVHTYAAAAIEKILILKKQAAPNVPESALVSSADLAPIAEPMLTGLFGAFELQVRIICNSYSVSLKYSISRALLKTNMS